ncbi:MAG TPA: hypothetical protein VN277_02390, partial [Acidiferrobacterales bacterium]|nr:hypothetical protein [Acidiferrobacterales bacterium]
MTRERIAKLERLLETLLRRAQPEEWPALSSSYWLEIGRMQGKILDYPVQGAPHPLEVSPLDASSRIGFGPGALVVPTFLRAS